MINDVMQVHGSYTGTEETRANHLSVVHRSTFSGGRSVEPFSTGPVPGPVRFEPHSFSVSLPPSHSSFFSLHYYRCRFFSEIRGANIPSWQTTVLQDQMDIDFPTVAFSRSKRVFPPLPFRGNECRKTY